MLAVRITDWKIIQCEDHSEQYLESYFQHCETCSTSWLLDPNKPFDWGLVKMEYVIKQIKLFL